MRSARGFTLIELIIVMAVISILTTIGIVNYNAFAVNQSVVKSIGEIQTILRLAQSNATSSTTCGGLGGARWGVIFRSDKKNIDLICGSNNSIQKTYTLENTEIYSVIGSSCNADLLPLTLTYSNGLGVLTFSSSSVNSSIGCLSSNNWVFTVRNTQNTTKTKTFTITKGGAIDVQ